MKILKKVEGHYVELELEKIEEYSNNYSLYQIYKYVNGKRVALYKQCYTDLEIKEMATNDYIVEEEVFE